MGGRDTGLNEKRHGGDSRSLPCQLEKEKQPVQSKLSEPDFPARPTTDDQTPDHPADLPHPLGLPQRLLIDGAAFCKGCGKDCHPVVYLPTPRSRKGWCAGCWPRVADGVMEGVRKRAQEKVGRGNVHRHKSKKGKG
jgi:hypothetical protein